MIYLTTGANGTGKTLNTLKAVREKQVSEGRTVYYNGFAMKPEKAAEFGWLPFDPREWQKLPDGAILLCDECQNEFPVRTSSEKLPEYVRGLSEHRRRGFDFYMVTQHPQNIDMFVRRLIGSPGYHRHLKRAFGADMVSVLEWSAVNGNCEKDGSGKSARVTMVPFPKEVYQWYDSATLHTGKKSIPRQVYVLGVLVVLVPVMFYFAYQKLMHKPLPVLPGQTSLPGNGSVSGAASGVGHNATPADYFASYVPRVPGLPHTAPRYDDVVKPVTAPFPAACVQSGKTCRCYTQQATRLDVPSEMCAQIVANGYFMDWQEQGDRAPVGRLEGGNPGAGVRAISPPLPPPARPDNGSDGLVLSAMSANSRSIAQQGI